MTMKAKDSVIITDAYSRPAEEGAYNYKGLPIHTTRGLHELCAEVVARHCEKGGNALDLGCGSGAMAQRLLDQGINVSCSDYTEDAFKLKSHVPFEQRDLNADFDSLFDSHFDLVVALELIEHLENPRHFLRNCHRLLKGGGTLLLSTPNIDSVPSKLLFLATGQHLWFSDGNYSINGHITPMSNWALNKIFGELGLKLIAQHSVGDPLRKLKKKKMVYRAAQILKFLRPQNEMMAGEVSIYVLKKKRGES